MVYVTQTIDEINHIVVIDYLNPNGTHVKEFHTYKDIYDTETDIAKTKRQITIGYKKLQDFYRSLRSAK